MLTPWRYRWHYRFLAEPGNSGHVPSSHEAAALASVSVSGGPDADER